ncbi:MAG: tyrosine--tRNA ligase [Puniceicoccales bacterium]|jgi:tyrosyl-tRNA synthetase|nr:tyrosine--tRNA ligase [Puniceicoccales bacterium]
MNPLQQICQGIDTIVGQDELKKKLDSGKQLRVKLGVDPTRPDLHFGHLVVFNKLKQFQDLGHETTLLIGDYTTTIGDPSGRSTERPMLSKEQIEDNYKTYVEQAFKVLDPAKTVIRKNSEWFSNMSFGDAILLSRQMTVAQMLEREDFSNRYKNKTPISIVEFLYPLLQGYDSIMLDSDVEIGGRDQLFNLLVGRTLQKNIGKEEQVVITMPLLVGLDGTKKMSKSYDNYIAFNDTAKDIFGKVMSISDETMFVYYKFLLLKTDEEIERLKTIHPMECKKSLAEGLCAKFYGLSAAKHEREQFEKVFSQNDIPDNMPNFSIQELIGKEAAPLVDVLWATNLFPSKKEIRRLFEQGALKVDGQKITDPSFLCKIPNGAVVVQSGKRTFLKITK